MLVGEIKSQIQSIWNDFWAGGLSNPLAVMEQVTYLLFIKRLDELQTLAELLFSMYPVFVRNELRSLT
jgi:type I restriction enzyme M protein